MILQVLQESLPKMQITSGDLIFPGVGWPPNMFAPAMLGLPTSDPAAASIGRDAALQQGLAGAFPLPKPPGAVAAAAAAVAAAAEAHGLSAPALASQGATAENSAGDVVSSSSGAFLPPPLAQNGPIAIGSLGGVDSTAKALQTGEVLASRLAALALKRSRGGSSTSLSRGAVDEDGKAQVRFPQSALHPNSLGANTLSHGLI